jgi:two-component system nitrogen regulation sensor histidine kinase NtrY
VKLRTRLIVVFLVVALLPLGLVIWQLTEHVTEHFTSQFERRANALGASVDDRFQQISDELNGAVEGIATTNPFFKTELLTLLRNPPLPDKTLRDTRSEAEKSLSNRLLDTFAVLSLRHEGRVIASGHHEGEPRPDRMAVERFKAKDKKPFFRQEEVDERQTGRVFARWTLQTQRDIEGTVGLVGGQLVDRLLDKLMVGVGGGDVLVSFEIDGERIKANFDGQSPPGPDGFEEREIVVTTVSELGSKAAFRIFMSRKSLVEAQGSIRRLGLALAGVAALLAFVLGFWLAGRLSKPLEELAGAATQVASGRRDLVVRERRGKDELAELIRAFNVMTDTLEVGEKRLKQTERIAAWQEIAKRIAHEIKNPLTPIQLNIELLQRSYRKEPERFDQHYGELISSTLQEVSRVGRIVNEFSNFARMPAPHRESVCLGELISSTLLMHQEVSAETQLSHTGAAVLEASVDQDQMRQVLTNLVKNAIEAVSSNTDSLHQGLVTVALTEETSSEGESFAVIAVEDNGPGIPAETMDKLFTPYFTTKTGGTGLGLAIVHRIVVEHGGNIEVSSREPHGTCFSIRLPV